MEQPPQPQLKVMEAFMYHFHPQWLAARTGPLHVHTQFSYFER